MSDANEILVEVNDGVRSLSEVMTDKQRRLEERYPLPLKPNRGRALKVGETPSWTITVGTQFKVLPTVPIDGMGRPFHEPDSIWEVIEIKRDYKAKVEAALMCKSENLLGLMILDVEDWQKDKPYLERIN